MKPLLRSAIAMLCLVAVLTSCNKKAPQEARYIPKNTGFVLVLDPKSMQDKLQKGGISIDTLLAKVFSNDSLDAKDKVRFEELRTNAGIDWNSQLYVYGTQKNSADNSPINIMNVLATITDAGKLEAFLKKQVELKDKAVVKESDYSYMLTGDGTMISWNKKQVIATVYNQTVKPKFDTVSMTFQRPVAVNSDAALKQEATTYFTQKEDQSLASVSVFNDMFKEKSDGYIFTNSNSSLGSLSMLPIQLPKLEELLKDNYSTATLSFEDGKIVAKSTTFTNPLVSSILKEYAGPTVNLSMIENYPSENINGIVLASFNPKIFGGILKRLEVEGLVNGFMQKTGFTSQDLYESLKGDIAVIVSDLSSAQPEPQIRKDESMLVNKKPFGKMIFNATVGDKVRFAKLMDKAVEQGFLVKQGTTYKGGSLLATMGLFVAADDKNLILASDSVTYTQYLSNTTKAVIRNDALSQFKGKSTVFYFDIANTLTGFINEATGNYDNSLRTAKANFKDVIATSENFDGKSVKALLEVRMQNEKQNSLVTLTSLLTDIAVDMRVQARRDREMEDKMFPSGIPAIIRTN